MSKDSFRTIIALKIKITAIIKAEMESHEAEG